MPECVHLKLRLEAGSGVPRGELVAGATARPFRGWLELLRCLEEARLDCPSRDDGEAGH